MTARRTRRDEPMPAPTRRALLTAQQSARIALVALIVVLALLVGTAVAGPAAEVWLVGPTGAETQEGQP
jgi:hypothetical protein